MGRPLRIKPLNVDVNASLPEGAVLVGHAKNGLPIYKVRRLATKNKPRTNKEGDVEYAKHPTTGEGLYQKRKVEWEYVDKYVIPNNQGNGNLSWDDYTPPSEEELAAAARERKIQELLPELAGALIDAEISPEALAAALKGQPVQPPAEIPPPARTAAEGNGPDIQPQAGTDEDGVEAGAETEPAADPEFPKALPGVGRWELSNGEVFKGTKIDAVSREKALAPPEH